MINVYLKSGGEPHELRVTLEWTVPFLLDTDFSLYMGVSSRQTLAGTHHALWHPQQAAQPF